MSRREKDQESARQVHPARRAKRSFLLQSSLSPSPAVNQILAREGKDTKAIIGRIDADVKSFIGRAGQDAKSIIARVGEHAKTMIARPGEGASKKEPNGGKPMKHFHSKEHPDIVFLKRYCGLPLHQEDGSPSEEEILWMETVAMELRPGERVFRTVVVASHSLFLVPICSRSTSYEAWARGFLRHDFKIECLELKGITKVEKIKKAPILFLEPELDVVSHVLALYGKQGEVLYEFNTFEDPTRLDFFLRTAWVNALIRLSTRLQVELLHSPPTVAKEYFHCISFTILNSTSLTEQNELMEELAFEVLRDESLKRLFFQSSSMLVMLYRSIGHFRADVVMTIKKLTEEKVAGAGGEARSKNGFSIAERRAIVWPLLRRLLGAVRLLYAALFSAEAVQERYTLLDNDREYSLPELARVLSEDLTDVINVFDDEGPPTYARRKSGNFALLNEKWEEKHVSGLSFLKSVPGTRMEALDMFATVHDTQVAILVLLDQIVQQHNLECSKTAFHHGVGTHLCRYSSDFVGFLRNLVSRLITYLDGMKKEGTKEKEEGKLEQDVFEVSTSKNMHARPSIDGSTPRGNNEFLKTLEVLRKSTIPHNDEADDDDINNNTYTSNSQQPSKSLQQNQSSTTSSSKRRMSGRRNHQSTAHRSVSKSSTSQTYPPPSLYQMATYFGIMYARGTSSLVHLPPSLPPSLRLIATYFGSMYTRRASSLSDRDPVELAARMERLKALVLLTQPHISLYNHALLLFEMIMDDYLVREAAKDACEEEIRHYLRPLIHELAPQFAKDPLHQLCLHYLEEVLVMIEEHDLV